MKLFLTFFLLSLISVPSQAEDLDICDDKCLSQLIRMNVDNNALEKKINTSNVQSALLPSIQAYFKSTTFKKLFLTEYPMPSMGFPFNYEQCKKDKARNAPSYTNVNCENSLMCSDPIVPSTVKADLCFTLPCAMVKGAQKMSECTNGALAKPAMISFPDPVSIKKMEITPLSVSIKGNILNGCFTLDELETSVGVQIEFAKEEIKYESIGLSGLNIKLDKPKKICMSAKIDLREKRQISEVKIITQEDHFVSDDMISKAATDASVINLTGYSATSLNTIKLLGVPPLARHFRPTIESAITKALANSFENQLVTMMTQDGPRGISSVSVPSDSMVSEIGVGNLGVKKYVDLLDCAITRAEGGTIPSHHPCFAVLEKSEIPSPLRAAQLLEQENKKYDHVTSDSIRSRLVEMGPRLDKLKLNNIYPQKLSPIVNRISGQLANSSLSQGIKLITQLSDGGTHTSLGVSIPKICNTQSKSPHEGHSILNCPVQAYIDLEELNRLMDVMYKTGRLCHRGAGDYTPARDNRGRQVYDGRGAPQGNGCLFIVEDNPNGMRCFLNGPPRLRFDSSNQGYKMDMKTKDCFRGAVVAGQGKIGGDINFDIGFVPSICNGDFCLDQGQANWNVVKGSERFALRDSSFLNGIVRAQIDKKINQVLKDSIRLPLNNGPLASVPLEAEGRVDKGPGYFGACLQYKESEN